ncbi:GPW/gp25 family protein [Paenibacillus monticola]|uniref:Lysozyme n=1 Tax=Paenibacillus monticola TaxID=2666075 RepID=A0A7X2L0C7_9BACL|nr:GPW/gp25 family protein [Paenibacillus monticola]MRN51998.1 lysozyme [Paenibacillus monticola]
MSTYTVDMTKPSRINFSPASVAEEVGQNLRTILSTALGSAPLARGIGIDYSMVDEPYQIAEARLTGEIYTAIAEQEPRALVVGVSFNGTITDAMTGRVAAIVTYTLAEGVE